MDSQISGSQPSGQKGRVAKATSHAPGAADKFGEECAVAAHTKQGSVWRHVVLYVGGEATNDADGTGNTGCWDFADTWTTVANAEGAMQEPRPGGLLWVVRRTSMVKW